MKKLGKVWSEYSFIFVLIVIFIVYAITSSGLTWSGVMNIFRHSAVIGTVALGMGLICLTGEIDLSVGSMLALTAGFSVIVFNITGSIDGPVDETILQSGVPVTKEYTTVCIPLTALKNGRYAHVGFTAEFVNPTEFDWFGEVETLGDVLLVDNVRIVDDQELAISGVEAASQSLLDVYTTDGKLVRRQAKSLAGLRGTFVVRQEGKGKTIVVR